VTQTYRLIITRHADPVLNWQIPDQERTLTPLGRRQSADLAHALLDLNIIPTQAFVSGAMRTRETWDCMAAVLSSPVPTTYPPYFYGGGYHEIAMAMTGVASDVGTVLVIGHNPGWSDAVLVLSGEAVALQTAGTVVLEAEGESWSEVMAMTGLWTVVKKISV